jgi:hypothetical protein
MWGGGSTVASLPSGIGSASRPLESFGVYAREWAAFRGTTSVATDVGVEGLGSPADAAYRLTVEKGASIDPAHSASADSILLDGGSTGALHTNHLFDRGGSHGTVDELPRMPHLPPVEEWPPRPPPDFSPVVTVIPRNTLVQLAEGSYGTIVLEEGARAVLTGAAYRFDDVVLRTGSHLDVRSSSRVVVLGHLDVQELSTVGSLEGGLVHKLRFDVLSQDGDKRHEPAVHFGPHNRVLADVFANAGTVIAREGTTIVGRVVAQAVDFHDVVVMPLDASSGLTCFGQCLRGQTRVCGEVCASPKNELGAACSVDPCDAGSLCGSAGGQALGCDPATSKCVVAALLGEVCVNRPCADDASCWSFVSGLFDGVCIPRGGHGDRCVEGWFPCDRGLICQDAGSLLPVGVAENVATCVDPCATQLLGEPCVATAECAQPGPAGTAVRCGIDAPSTGVASTLALDCCVPRAGDCFSDEDCCGIMEGACGGTGGGDDHAPKGMIIQKDGIPGPLGVYTPTCITYFVGMKCLPRSEPGAPGQCGVLTEAPPPIICQNPFAWSGEAGISTTTDFCVDPPVACGRKGAECHHPATVTPQCDCCFGFACDGANCVCGGEDDFCQPYSTTGQAIEVCCPDLQCVFDPVNGPRCKQPTLPTGEKVNSCIPIDGNCNGIGLPCCEGTCDKISGKCPCGVDPGCIVNGSPSYFTGRGGSTFKVPCCSDFSETPEAPGKCCTPNKKKDACCMVFVDGDPKKGCFE